MQNKYTADDQQGNQGNTRNLVGINHMQSVGGTNSFDYLAGCGFIGKLYACGAR